MDKHRRTIVKAGIAGTGVALFTGCETLHDVAVAAGVPRKLVDSVAKTFEDFTPRQEYYIGRTVSANIYQNYRPLYDDEKLSYLNKVGLSLAYVSDQPETFGGYHFAILDSNEINAFAAPGGFIFVTRGMLRCCPHEDALAAVLAHEIAHVQLKHGLQAIKDSRVTEAITILASEAASQATEGDLSALIQNFEGSITDITSTMVNSGYSRSYEKEADALALNIMDKAGFSRKGMQDMLSVMDKNLKPGGTDFFKTHPSPQERLGLVNSKIQNAPAVPEFRKQRLKINMGQV